MRVVAQLPSSKPSAEQLLALLPLDLKASRSRLLPDPDKQTGKQINIDILSLDWGNSSDRSRAEPHLIAKMSGPMNPTHLKQKMLARSRDRQDHDRCRSRRGMERGVALFCRLSR